MNNLCLQAVQKFSTPLYVYSQAVIEKQIKALKSAFSGYPRIDFLYAIKANPNPHLVQIILDHGLGIDAVSLNEAKLALFLGCPTNKIMFTENNISDSEMEQSVQEDILINFNSIQRLESFGKKYPGHNVCIRFNPNVSAASHETNLTAGPDNKFGISYQKTKEVQEIAQKYNLKIVGVHQHIGSGWLSIKEPLIALDVLLDIAIQFPDLEFIDFGGGFGIPYKPSDKPLDLNTLASHYTKRFTEFNQLYNQTYSYPESRFLTFKFEPGRYIIAESGQLVTQVTTIKKTSSKKTFIGTDTGMNHLIRPAFYDSYHPIINLSNPNGTQQKYDVVGNICECADYFAKDRLLPETKVGDFLSIQLAGAYGSSMSSLYQLRSNPPEVLIDNQNKLRLIKKEQTLSDMLNIYQVD